MQKGATSKHQAKACDIAIIGMESIFPGSQNKFAFWQDILLGKNRITEVPKTHWLASDYYDANPKAKDKTYSQKGGFIPHVSFDPLEFGLPPKAFSSTDSGQILGLVTAKRTLADAHLAKDLGLRADKVSVILGTTGATELIMDMASRLERPKWHRAILEQGFSEQDAEAICERIASYYPEWQESSFPGLLSNVVAGRIAHRLNLQGTNMVTDAACASSLAALRLGIDELLLGRSDLVLTGGVDTLNTILMYMCFSKTPALSRQGDCRPFSAEGDGTLLGEGIGLLAIKRLKDAQAHNDRIYAVIKGMGSGSDGLGKSVYAPLAAGQARTLQQAYAQANYAPDTVELVEGHGTGTQVGDATELESLQLCFGKEAKAQSCAIGSVKSQIGHTKAAAGAAGLIKAILALQHKVLPPTIKVDTAHKKLQEKDCAFYANTKLRPWIRDSKHPRRASVSSFGFGGSNFHVALEEYVPSVKYKDSKRKKLRTFTSELCVFAASSQKELLKKLEEALILSQKVSSIHAFASDLQKLISKNAKAQPYRACVLAQDTKDFCEKLKELISRLQEKSENIWEAKKGIYYAFKEKAGKVAFLFPGQGSQKLNMGAGLALNFESCRKVWDQIASFDLAQSDQPLHHCVYPVPALEKSKLDQQAQYLQQTQWAQPALAACSATMLSLLKSFGVNPDVCAGHSLGEYTALYASKAINLEQLVSLTRQRGLHMSQSTEQQAGMIAVKANAKSCEKLLAQLQSSVVVANLNSDEQTVLSGSKKDLKIVEQKLREQKIWFSPLAVMTAFHSPLMQKAQKAFAKDLQTTLFSKLQVPTYSNVSAQLFDSKPQAVSAVLQEQICSSVRFHEMISTMYEQGVENFIEVGPRNILTRLVRKILAGKNIQAIALEDDSSQELASFWNSLAQLFVSGIDLDFACLSDEYEETDTVLHKKSAMAVQLNGANLGRKYPFKAPLKKAPQTWPQKLEKHISEKVKPKRKVLAQMEQDNKPQAVAQTLQDQNLEWLKLFHQTQNQTLQIHSQFQKSMAEAHTAFLQTTQSCLQSMLQLGTGGLVAPQAKMPPSQVQQPSAVPPQTQPTHAPVNVSQAQTSLQAPKVVEPEPQVDSNTQTQLAPVPVSPPSPAPDVFKLPIPELDEIDEPVAEVPSPQFPPAEPVIHAPEQSHQEQAFESTQVDLQKSLLEVIADKTGYPQEMLNMSMSLEQDLGIDSIKRVEIFSSLSESINGLEDLEAGELAKLHTLDEIKTYLEGFIQQAGATVKKKSANLGAPSPLNA